MNMEAAARVRAAAVAGQFYPGSAPELRLSIEQALTGAAGGLPGDTGSPKALIVPHAGYIYSGPTAAFAYAAVRGAPVRRVVLLGPAHRVPFYGMALPEAEFFSTPLGDVPLDVAAMELIRPLLHVRVNGAAHAMEHSLEVQLPFLQMVLGAFGLVPLCLGSVEPVHVAGVMERLWNGPDTLFVISSDLSHYHPYDAAVALDRQSIEVILNGEAGLSHDQACGATGINALLLIAKARGMRIRLLDYRNSGDTAGDRNHVVGYTSIAFYDGGDR